MAQVPYSPVPDQSPSQQGTPPLRSPPNLGAAFGENIGVAIQHLGRVTAGAGDELFTRAMALQALGNQAEKDDLGSKYMIEAGKLHADYSSKQGKAAVDAYPKYEQDLRDLRESIGGEASNPAVAKLYQSESLPLLGRTIFNGAGHAATENKKYLDNSSKAKVQALGDQALANPEDEEGFKAGLTETSNQVRTQGDINGWSDEQINQEVAKQVSTLSSLRIAGLAKTKPQAAKEMLDRALDNGQIRGESVAKISNIVQNQLHTVGARNISHDINNPESIAGIPGQFIDQIRKSEGYRDKPYWDFKQWTSGYGTKASGPNENVSKAEHEQRFQAEINKAAEVVDRVNPNLSAGTRAALTSLTYNAGPSWTDARLGKMIEAGDEQGAKESFLQYNKAGGQTNKGLVSRRNQEASWFGKEKDPQDTLTARVDKGKAIAKENAPDDPLYQDHVEQRIIADYNRDKALDRSEELENKQTIESGIIGGFGNGKMPTTVEELRATDAKVDVAWDRLKPSEQRKYLGVLAHNAKGDTAWTNEGMQRYQSLKGMAQSDPATFLEQDLLDEKLPFSAKRELINLQSRLKDKAEGDPRITKALKSLQPILGPAGLGSRTKENAEQHDQFTGALQDAIQDYQDENKKPPKQDELNQIATRLLQEQHTSWWQSSQKQFETPIPDELLEKVKDSYTKMGGAIPTDEQIRREYSRQQYQKLYGKKSKSQEASQ